MPDQSSQSSIQRTINWVILGVALAGRLGLSLLLQLNPRMKEPWDLRLMSLTLILVSFFIIINYRDLKHYKFSKLSVWMILVFKLLSMATIVLSSPNRPLVKLFEPLELLAVAALLGVALSLRDWLFSQPLADPKEWKWLGIAVLGGLLVVALSAYPQALQIRGMVPDFNRPSWSNLLLALIALPFQIGYAGVFEDPIFRGILWGKLRQSRWGNLIILLFQTFLFSLAHIHYLPHQAYAFWVTVPLGGLMLGAVAWGSGSLAAPMLAHGIINNLIGFAAYAAYFWFL